MTAAGLGERPDYRCSCPEKGHDHDLSGEAPRGCSRRGTIAGGVCLECRYWLTFPERARKLPDNL